jgi:molybdopterin converting factor small subunit
MTANGASMTRGCSTGPGDFQIQVKLYGGLGKYAKARDAPGIPDLDSIVPGERAQFGLTMRQGATLGDVIDTCALPRDSFVSLINGRRAHRDTLLNADDTLVFFPPISGG